MNEIKDWVLVSREQFREIDPGFEKRPIPESYISDGYMMAGPFVIESTAKDNNFPDLFINLRFYVDPDTDKKITSVASDIAVHLLETIGRIKFENNSIEIRTKEWGKIKVRAIAPKDAKLFAAKLGKNPTIEEMVNAYWPDEED